MRIGELSGVKVISMITNMSQPLGRFIGNSLEIKECLDILQNKTCEENGVDFYYDTKELSLQLAAHMVVLAKKAANFEEAYEKAVKALSNGEAFEVFKKMCLAQGAENVFDFPLTTSKHVVKAPSSGYIHSFNTEGVGQAGVLLKAGRMKTDDQLIYENGIELHCKLGMSVKKDQPLFTLHCNDQTLIKAAEDKLFSCIEITDAAPKQLPLIFKTIGI